MATDATILDEIQEFLRNNVANKIKLQKPTDDDISYELINPSVHIGWIPPKLPENFSMEEQVSDIPCILVGEDGGEDDGDESGITVKLSFVVYNAGTIKNGKLFPDFKGYRDLINLFSLTRIKLFLNGIVGKSTIVEKPVRWGMYEDQIYPYWHGWMTFKVLCEVVKQTSSIEESYE